MQNQSHLKLGENGKYFEQLGKSFPLLIFEKRGNFEETFVISNCYDFQKKWYEVCISF